MSVCGTGAPSLARGFSWRFGSNPLALAVAAADHRLSVNTPWHFTQGAPYRLGGLSSLGLPTRVPPSLITGTVRYGNINPLSIAYGSRPRLRPDSPAADQHGCGTLGPSVGRIHTALALLIPAFSLVATPAVLTLDLHSRPRRSPTMKDIHPHPRLRCRSLAPIHRRRRCTRPVSYYALFQGWLLLSQPPGCLGTPTSLPT